MSSDKDVVRLRKPASWHGEMWREALPTGNGIIGAAVYGAIASETILVNHGDLWHWGKRSPLLDVSHTLQEVRELLDRGDFQQAKARLMQRGSPP